MRSVDDQAGVDTLRCNQSDNVPVSVGVCATSTDAASVGMATNQRLLTMLCIRDDSDHTLKVFLQDSCAVFHLSYGFDSVSCQQS